MYKYMLRCATHFNLSFSFENTLTPSNAHSYPISWKELNIFFSYTGRISSSRVIFLYQNTVMWTAVSFDIVNFSFAVENYIFIIFTHLSNIKFVIVATCQEVKDGIVTNCNELNGNCRTKPKWNTRSKLFSLIDSLKINCIQFPASTRMLHEFIKIRIYSCYYLLLHSCGLLDFSYISFFLSQVRNIQERMVSSLLLGLR